MSAAPVWRSFWSSHDREILATAIATAVAVVVALIIVVVATPVYRASTHVSIRPRIADLGAAEAAARLVRNYAVWVDSKAYAARVPAESRGGLSDGQIVKNVRASGDPDRLLVTIQSEDDRPARAASTVNALAEALVAEVASPARVNDPQRGLEISIIDPALTPTVPVWPRPEIVLPLAAGLGAVLGGALAWLLRAGARPDRETTRG